MRTSRAHASGGADHFLRLAQYFAVATTYTVSGSPGAIVPSAEGNGEVYETETPAALKHASRITQTQPSWTWTDEDPRKKK